MPPTALTYRPTSFRCLTIGGGAADAAAQGMMGGSRITPPTGRKWLNFNYLGARGAGGRKARFCPAEGQGRAFCVLVFYPQSNNFINI